MAPRLLLIVLVLVTYSPAATAEFVRFDDAYTLHHNPRLNPPSWQSLGSYWREWRTGEFGLYVPVTYTVWTALAWAGRVDQPDLQGTYLNPWVFHSASIALHAVAALLVFSLLKRLLRASWPAWMGAAIWALHPFQVEPVAWASGMKDVLAGTLALLSIWFYVKASPDAGPEQGSRGTPRETQGADRIALIARIAAYLTAVLAMLSKPSAIVIGPICLILEVLLLDQPARKAFVRVLPMLLIAIPITLVARYVQDVDQFTPPPIWLRPFVAGDALTFYLGKLILPFKMAQDYGRRPGVMLARPVTYAIAIVPILLALAVWRWRQRFVIAGGLIFFIALLPVLGLASFQFQLFSTPADHYVYVALLGPALAVAWAISLRPSRATYTVASIAIALLAILSFLQARTWRDDFALFAQTLAVNPNSFLAHNNLGLAYEEQAARADQAGDLRRAAEMRKAATEQYKQAVESNPDFAAGYAHLASMSRQSGDHERAAWAMLQALRTTLALPERARGDYLNLVMTLSDDLMAAGRYEQAARFLEQYVRARPNDAGALVKLAGAQERAKRGTGGPSTQSSG